MPKLRNRSIGDSNPGSLDCKSGILPLSYRAPLYCNQASDQHSYLLHLILRHGITQLRLLEAGRIHPLVRVRLSAGHGRVGGVEAGLNEGLTPLARDHRLQLASGERVHVASLAGDQ